MKAKYTLQILSLLFLTIGLASCSREETVSTDAPKEYNISLKFNGEITTTDLPLTRSTEPNDLIGVQVYQDNTAYAYGLFDNAEDININLFSDHKYKFVVTIIKDGKNLITIGDSYYDIPFNMYLNNKFTYSTTDKSVDFGIGNTRFSYTTTASRYPKADRFYGELDNYTPMANGSLAIDLKRTAFGLKYEVSGVSDGTISVKISNTSQIFFENSTITADFQSEEEIFTFYDVYSAWLYADNYTESITVTVSWARDVGIAQDLGNKTVQIKRNAMNIIRLSLSSVDYEGNIGIEVEEETNMNEETVTGELK